MLTPFISYSEQEDDSSTSSPSALGCVGLYSTFSLLLSFAGFSSYNWLPSSSSKSSKVMGLWWTKIYLYSTFLLIVSLYSIIY